MHMKTLALGLAFLLAMPLMLDEASAAERGGGGSSRDSGGRGSFSRDASPSRGGGERQSVQRDASPSRSFSGRQARSAPSGAPTSREMRTPDRGALSESRSRVETGTRGAAEARQPGGMSSGTAFPRSDAHPRAATTQRLDTSRQGDGRSAPVRSNRLDAVRSSGNDKRIHTERGVDEQRSSRVGTTQSNDVHSGDDKPIRIERTVDGNRMQGHAGSRENQDRLHNSREGDGRDKASGNPDRRGNDWHAGSGGEHDGRTGDHFDHKARHSSGDHTKRWHTGSRSHWHGDIRHFKRHDFDKWRHGSWHHGHHHGRIGWWWIVGPSWYFYPGPVYPYPNPYVPPVVVVSERVVDDTDYWYYCEEADDYYPYVEECAGKWIPIPVEPENAMPPRY